MRTYVFGMTWRTLVSSLGSLRTTQPLGCTVSLGMLKIEICRFSQDQLFVCHTSPQFPLKQKIMASPRCISVSHGCLISSPRILSYLICGYLVLLGELSILSLLFLSALLSLIYNTVTDSCSFSSARRNTLFSFQEHHNYITYAHFQGHATLSVLLKPFNSFMSKIRSSLCNPPSYHAARLFRHHESYLAFLIQQRKIIKAFSVSFCLSQTVTQIRRIRVCVTSGCGLQNRPLSSTFLS